MQTTAANLSVSKWPTCNYIFFKEVVLCTVKGRTRQGPSVNMQTTAANLSVSKWPTCNYIYVDGFMRLGGNKTFFFFRML